MCKNHMTVIMVMVISGPRRGTRTGRRADIIEVPADRRTRQKCPTCWQNAKNEEEIWNKCRYT